MKTSSHPETNEKVSVPGFIGLWTQDYHDALRRRRLTARRAPLFSSSYLLIFSSSLFYMVDEKEFGKKVISVARNPVLFDIFHRLQLIEKVGTGVQRIIEAIQARKLSIEFYFGSFFSITFFRPDTRSLALSRHQVGTKSGLSWGQVGTKLGLSRDYVAKILEYCLEERAIADIMALFNRKSRTKFRKTFINPLIKEDFLAMKIPVKPRSAKQKYVITERGKKFLEHINKKEQR